MALSGIYETRNTIKDAQCAFDTSVHVLQCKWTQIFQDKGQRLNWGWEPHLRDKMRSESENIRETENTAEGVRQYQKNWNERVENLTPQRWGRSLTGRHQFGWPKKGRKEHFDLPQNDTVVQGLLRKYKILIIIIIIIIIYLRDD